MTDPDNWAKEVEAEIKSQQDEASRRDQSIAMKARLLDKHAPLLWEELVQAFEVYADAYNKMKKATVLVVSQPGIHLFFVKRDGLPAAIEGQYDHRTRAISIKASNSSITDTYRAKVFPQVDEGLVLLVSENESIATTPLDIAQNVLTEFLKH
jgi:hypothetical protein